MEIKIFEGVDRSELSMIEVAHAILEQHGEVMDFSDLTNEIQNYLSKTDVVIREELAQFYTDLNIDGSFISLGENRWGLRSWYPFESIDEEVSSVDDEDEDTPKRKKRKKVNAFIGMDEDAIDYNDDDPEDSDLAIDDDDTDDLYDEDDDENEEISAYNQDLSELGADDFSDDEEIVPEGVEDELTIIDDEDVDDIFDEDDEEV